MKHIRVMVWDRVKKAKRSDKVILVLLLVVMLAMPMFLHFGLVDLMFWLAVEVICGVFLVLCFRSIFSVSMRG